MAALTPLRAGSIPASNVHVKLLAHGRSGAGKSRLGATMPKPAILLLEANGLPTIRQANPDAIVFLAYDPTSYGLETPFDVVQSFVRMGVSGELTLLGAESAVVDSATEVQRVIRDQILREMGQHKNPGYQFTQQNWGVLTERMRRFMRTFRDFPMHCLAITLTNEEKDEAEVVSLVPSFEGRKLSGEVAQFFSAVGYCFKREVRIEEEGVRTDIEHRVLFQGASKYLVKPIEPLRSIEEPDASAWIARIVAHQVAPPGPPIAQTAGPAAPMDAKPDADAPAATVSTDAPVDASPASAAPSTPPIRHNGSGGNPVTTTTTRRSRAAKQPEADPTA